MRVFKVVAALPLEGEVVQEADHQVALLPHLHSCREPSPTCGTRGLSS